MSLFLVIFHLMVPTHPSYLFQSSKTHCPTFPYLLSPCFLCHSFKLYFSLTLPHLSYCSSVWDPPSNSCDSALLEKTQFFALKMCSHKWNVSYTPLLSLFGIPSLSVRRSHSKLLFLFKILNHLIYFPPPHIFILKPPPHYPIHVIF